MYSKYLPLVDGIMHLAMNIRWRQWEKYVDDSILQLEQNGSIDCTLFVCVMYQLVMCSCIHSLRAQRRPFIC